MNELSKGSAAELYADGLAMIDLLMHSLFLHELMVEQAAEETSSRLFRNCVAKAR